MVDFKDRKTIIAKKCFDRHLNPTQVCVNLGEVVNENNKRIFFCNRDFPKNCNDFKCPHYMAVPNEWLKDLKKLEIYV